MKTVTISTKEIRNDLEGFLKRLKNGQTIQVLYRSKSLVTLVAKEEGDQYESADAGTQASARRSLKFLDSLPKREPVFDSNKSFKELYEETRTQ